MIVVDDHSVVRYGFAARINIEQDMEVCGEAATAHEALAEIDRLQPDVVLIDLSLADGDGLDLIKDLRTRGDRIRMLVISSHDECVYAERALRAGAHGYVQKAEAVDKIVDGIRHVMANEFALNHEIAATVLKQAFALSSISAGTSIHELSDRELQVYALIGQGLTIPQIALKLFLSPKTIETYRQHLKRKLKLSNSVQLTRQAIEWTIQQGKSSSMPNSSGEQNNPMSRASEASASEHPTSSK